MSFLDDIKLPLTVLGIEYVLTADSCRIFTVLVQKKKGELVILEKQELSSSDFEAYLEEKSTNTRILLSGKGLLTTKGSPKEAFISEQRDGYLTMIRKETYPSDLQQFSNNPNFAGLVLGAPFLKAFTKKIGIEKGHSFCYDLEQEEMRSYWDLPSTTIPLSEEDHIQSDYLGAYLTAISVFLKDEPLVTPNIYSASDFYKNLFFKRVLVASGAVFLLLLVINFFLWDGYVKENNLLASNASFNKANIKTFQKEKEELKIKKEYLTKSGLGGKQLFSFYADRIGVSVPKSIQLTAMTLHEYDKAILKKEKRYDFDIGSIKIQGISKQILDLNKWVDQLEQMDWIQKIDVQDYSYNSKKKVALFNLTIELK